MNDNNKRVLNFSVSDYFDLFYKYHDRKKLVAFITPKQVAYMIGTYYDHWEKTTLLSQQLFPYRNYDHNNLYEGAISMYSVGDDLEIYMPDVIDKIQYQCLRELINEIDEYEKNNDVNIDHSVFDRNGILEEAKSKLRNIKEEDEEIISEPITFGKDIMDGRPHNILSYHNDENKILGV